MSLVNNKIPRKGFDLRVNLNPEDFDKLIETHGVRINAYKTVLCPNVKKVDTMEHEIDCTLCNGNLFVDRYPTEGYVFLQSQKIEKMFNVEGVFDDQMVLGSFVRGLYLQYFAKIELLDFTTTFYEIIQRQIGNIDRLKYKALLVNYILDKNGIEYQQDKDFIITTDTKDIQWLSGNRPAQNVTYSIHYEYLLTFRVLRALHVNRFSQFGTSASTTVDPVEHSQQWVMKRDYLITKEDIAGAPISSNKIIVNTNTLEI